jgi:hypothetical protein
MSHVSTQTHSTIGMHDSRRWERALPHRGRSLLQTVLDILVPSHAECLPGVASAERFRSLLRCASARADQTNQGFSVVAFDAGNREDRETLHRVLADRLRLTDEIGRFGDSWIGVFLYEAPSKDAWRFAQSVRTILGEMAVPVRCNVYSYPVDRQRIRDAGRRACEQSGKQRAQGAAQPAIGEPEAPVGLVLEGALA